MASPVSSEPRDKFAEAESLITSVMDIPIRLLTERKQAMLAEVATLRGEYHEVIEDRDSSISELKASKEELQCIASLMKANQAQGEMVKSITNLDSRISALESEVSAPPSVEFKHSSSDLLQIETLVKSFGRVECESFSTKVLVSPNVNSDKAKVEVTEQASLVPKTVPPLKPRDYSAIKSPQTRLAKFGKGPGEFSDPACMLIDEMKNCVYVCDAGNGRIQVLTLNGEYLSEFGNRHLVSPVGIAMCSGATFITDFFKQRVFKFNHADLSNALESKKISYPHGLDSADMEVFVAEPFKHRVLVLTPELEHVRTLGTGIVKKCYGIKVKEGVLYAQEYNTNTIKLLDSLTGELLRSVATNKDGEFLFNATFFSMDVAGNFFVTDMVADQLKILSPTGELLAKMNFKGWKSNEPKAVAVTSDKKLFIGFGEGENSILVL